MGIVYNIEASTGYIDTEPWPQMISRSRAFQVLTASNRAFLQSLGLIVRE